MTAMLGCAPLVSVESQPDASVSAPDASALPPLKVAEPLARL